MTFINMTWQSRQIMRSMHNDQVVVAMVTVIVWSSILQEGGNPSYSCIKLTHYNHHTKKRIPSVFVITTIKQKVVIVANLYCLSFIKFYIRWAECTHTLMVVPNYTNILCIYLSLKKTILILSMLWILLRPTPGWMQEERILRSFIRHHLPCV